MVSPDLVSPDLPYGVPRFVPSICRFGRDLRADAAGARGAAGYAAEPAWGSDDGSNAVELEARGDNEVKKRLGAQRRAAFVFSGCAEGEAPLLVKGEYRGAEMEGQGWHPTVPCRAGAGNAESGGR